jgi:hypothetical protein
VCDVDPAEACLDGTPLARIALAVRNCRDVLRAVSGKSETADVADRLGQAANQRMISRWAPSNHGENS